MGWARWRRAWIASTSAATGWSTPASGLLLVHVAARLRVDCSPPPQRAPHLSPVLARDGGSVRGTLRLSTTTAWSSDAAGTDPTVLPEETTITCTDGTVLAVQVWRSPATTSAAAAISPTEDTTTSRTRRDKEVFVLTHGWMDNCRSFHLLAPKLATRLRHQNVSLYALDWPGHGRSSHKSMDAPPMVQAELAYYLAEAVQSIQQSEHANTTSIITTLIGHSLGAGISSLYAAAFPETIDRLILLEGAGFVPRPPEDTAKHVREHVMHRQRYNRRLQNGRPPRIFSSLGRAVQARLRNVKTMPGNQTMSVEAATELVQRATVPVSLSGDSGTSPKHGVQFRHDPRFAWPSIQYMTWPQIEGIFQTIGQYQGDDHAIDGCLLLADEGWPFSDDHLARTLDLLQPSVYQRLPGSHYFHADPRTAEAVVAAIEAFCERTRRIEPLK